MPICSAYVRLSGWSGSGRRTVRTTRLTHKRHAASRSFDHLVGAGNCVDHSGNPAFRRPSEYVAKSSGRRSGGNPLRSDTRNVGWTARRTEKIAGPNRDFFLPRGSCERKHACWQRLQSQLLRECAIDRCAADLECFRDSGRSHAVAFHLFDLRFLGGSAANTARL
jgi:hypothetical protein